MLSSNRACASALSPCSARRWPRPCSAQAVRSVVAGLAGELEPGAQPRLGALDLARPRSPSGPRRERTRADRGVDVAVEAQERLEPAHGLALPHVRGSRTARAPRRASARALRHRSRARRRARRAGCPARASSRSSHSLSSRAAGERPGVLRRARAYARRGAAGPSALAALGEPLGGELAHGLEHREAVALRRGRGSPRPAPRDRRRRRRAHLLGRLGPSSRPRRRRGARRARAAARRAGRGSRRSSRVSVRCRAGASRAAGEHGQLRLEPVGEPRGRRPAGARGRELERER